MLIIWTFKHPKFWTMEHIVRLTTKKRTIFELFLNSTFRKLNKLPPSTNNKVSKPYLMTFLFWFSGNKMTTLEMFVFQNCYIDKRRENIFILRETMYETYILCSIIIMKFDIM